MDDIMPGLNLINLADINDKVQRARANDQAMALQDMKMQAAMGEMQKQKSLRDLVSSAYTPASPAVPFETDEEAFMGQPSLQGLTAKPATRGRMDYDRLEQGLAGMGDFNSLMKLREQRAGANISKAHQEKIKAAQGFVDAGDQEGLRQFVLADDETPDDVDVVTNQDGSMTLQSSQWPEPRTIKPSPKRKGMPGSSTPYFSPVQTGGGLYAFDHRTAGITPLSHDGRRIVGSTSDPNLQGRLSEAKEEGKTVGEQRGMIGGKYQAVDSVRDAKKLINDGIYAGYYGEMKKTLAKANPLADKTKAANTERFISHIGNVVIPRLKEFGGNDSNEEMKYLQRVMAGDITMEPEALMKILDDAEKKIQQGIERLNRGELGAPQVQEGTIRRNRRTGEVQVFQGGQWQRQ